MAAEALTSKGCVQGALRRLFWSTWGGGSLPAAEGTSRSPAKAAKKPQPVPRVAGRWIAQLEHLLRGSGPISVCAHISMHAQAPGYPAARGGVFGYSTGEGRAVVGELFEESRLCLLAQETGLPSRGRG